MLAVLLVLAVIPLMFANHAQAVVDSTTTTTSASVTTVTSNRTVTSTQTSTITTVSNRTFTSTITTTITSATTTHLLFHNVTVDSNSTVLSYVLTAGGVNVTVIGANGTVGHMRIVIPRSLIGGSPIVLIDNGHAPILSETVSVNATHWILDAWYHHSVHTVSVISSIPIPEFPAGLLPVLALALLLPVVLLKRKR